MASEHLMKTLYDLCVEKFDEYIEDVKTVSIDNGLNAESILAVEAYRYTTYGDILSIIGTTGEYLLTDEQCKMLIYSGNPLAYIYDEYIEMETEWADDIRYAIESCADRMIERKEN